MNLLFITIALPFIMSALAFASRKRAAVITVSTCVAEVVMAATIFVRQDVVPTLSSFQSNILSDGIFLAAAFITSLIVLYSLCFMEDKARLNEYYCYILVTLGAAAGVFFSADFLLLITFWGILGATLYLLMGIGGSSADAPAKKAFIIVGGSDALMMVAVGMILIITKSLQVGPVRVELNDMFSICAYLLLATGAFAKMGLMPLHSWVTDAAESSPVPVMALLPSSMDKLLGIYLLARISMDIFILTPGSAVSTILMLLGSITVITAVMAAMVQHNLKKLLSYHAVSQVGYMVMGIGTGLPVGIGGALLHMLNNAIYKCCLFLCAGSVEKKSGTSDLDRLGLFATTMPITFASALIASLAISGIPPLNGFISKWLIYQAIIETASWSPLWMIWLTAAMFGSALTLASFIKFIHAAFLGEGTAKGSEVPWQMWLPTAVLAGLCVVFGVFAAVPISFLILPSVHGFSVSGSFSPLLASALLLLGLLLGGCIYWISTLKNAVVKPPYIGGEKLAEDMVKVPATHFYDPIKDWWLVKNLYRLSEKGAFNLYSMLTGVSFSLNRAASLMHNGLLHTYLAWIFLGALIILAVLII